MAARKPAPVKKKKKPAPKAVLGNDPFARGSAVRVVSATAAAAPPPRPPRPITPELQVALPPGRQPSDARKPVLQQIDEKPRGGSEASQPAPALTPVRPAPRAATPELVRAPAAAQTGSVDARPRAGTPSRAGSPSISVVDPRPHAGTPTAQELSGPAAHAGSPTAQQLTGPAAHAGSPTAQQLTGPAAHAGSPSVTVDPRPHAGTPTAHELSGPAAHAGSPSAQRLTGPAPHSGSPSASVDPRQHADTPTAQELSGPAAHAGSPSAQRLTGPTPHSGSPSVSVDPRPHAGTPTAQELSGPAAHAGSPSVTVDPRPHAGAPTAQQLSGPAAHSGSPSAHRLSGPTPHAGSPSVTVDPRPHAGAPTAERLSGSTAHSGSPFVSVDPRAHAGAPNAPLAPRDAGPDALATPTVASALKGLFNAARTSAGLASRATEVDRWGKDVTLANSLRPLGELLYDKYWRVRVEGTEHLPSGPFIIVANHAGALPLDGPVLHLALRRERPDLEESRWLLEDQIFHAPFVGVLANRLGAVRASPENALRLLDEQRPLIVFPEGFHGLSKPFSERYQLKRFGRGGYVKIALRAKVPIIPAAIIGGEESMPLLAKLPGGFFGLQYLPITLPPLPARWHIRFAPPVSLEGAPSEPEHDLAWVERKNLGVRDQIESMLTDMLQHRDRIF